MPATVMLGEQDETAVDGQKQSDAFGNQRKNGNDNRILGEESWINFIGIKKSQFLPSNVRLDYM